MLTRSLRTAVMLVGLTALFSASLMSTASVGSAASDAQVSLTPTRDLFPGPGMGQATPTPARGITGPGQGAAQVTPTPTRSTLAPGSGTAQELQPPLIATLIGGAEVPGPGDEDGIGSASVIIDQELSVLCYALHAVNIEPPTAAHIHQGGVDIAGEVVVPLNAPTGGNASDCIRGLDRDLLERILQDPRAFYVNVHNENFPGGAVRGQLGR